MSFLNRALKFYRSIRHTRKSQLFHRLRLMLVRKLNQRNAQRLRAAMAESPIGSLDLNLPLPLPILEPRKGLFRLHEDGAYEFCFLNQSIKFAVPMDWHRSDLEAGTRLWLLNLHYMEYLEEVSDDEFELLIVDWISNCPPYRKGYWLDDWNSFSLSIRVVVWMQQFAIRGSRLCEDFKQLFLVSLKRQLRFLYDNLELDIGGNHLVKNIKALLWGSRFFDCSECEKWERKGLQLLKAAIAEQILDDGLHYERSPAYHIQVFVDLLEVQSVLSNQEDRHHLLTVLSSMAQVAADLTHPDGKISLFNDGALNMAYQPGECLKYWSSLAENDVTPNSLIELPSAGYYGIRDDSSMLLVDCGKIAPDFLPAHGHGDILAFEWTVDGQRVVVDFGVFEYNAGEFRRKSRATESHNTVTVADQDQCEFWGAFRVARRTYPVLSEFSNKSNGFRLTGRHDGFAHLEGTPVHQRQFVVNSPEDFEVIDQVSGGAGQPVNSRLLINPDFEVTFSGERQVTLTKGELRLEVISNRPFAVRDYWWCPDFGVKLSCQQLEFEYGPAPCDAQICFKKVS